MQYKLNVNFCNIVPIPVDVCSWYLSMSIWRLVVKKSSLAMSLWYMETMSFFCLDSEELCLRRLILKKGKQIYIIASYDAVFIKT